MQPEQLIGAIKKMAAGIQAETVSNRRYLHAHPELSFYESETAGFVASRLDELKIPYLRMAGNGIVGLLKGKLPSQSVVALRADMDALPIPEQNNTPYVSQYPGVMHACGHDAHTASLLGTASILAKLRPHFGGTVKLIFQPAEEKLPGGASLMIREGVLDHPRPSAMIGQHVMPELEAGKIGIRSGKYMASNDELYVTIHGKGGHGAQPHDNIDPVVIASHIIIALQQIVSRIADPQSPSVLSFGKVVANGAVNIIPDEVQIEGTFRSMDEEWRKQAHEKMKKMAIGIAEAMGATCTFEIIKGYPFLINEEKLTASVRKLIETYAGKENVVDLDIWMAAEDFAYYSQVADACFYRLGTGNKERGITSLLHTPTFDVDENALEVSTGLMAYLAVMQLSSR